MFAGTDVLAADRLSLKFNFTLAESTFVHWKPKFGSINTLKDKFNVMDEFFGSMSCNYYVFDVLGTSFTVGSKYSLPNLVNADREQFSPWERRF